MQDDCQATPYLFSATSKAMSRQPPLTVVNNNKVPVTLYLCVTPDERPCTNGSTLAQGGKTLLTASSQHVPGHAEPLAHPVVAKSG
jgi:hypothetical protein